MQHLVELWDSLPQEVDMAANMDIFKRDWTNAWRIKRAMAPSHLNFQYHEGYQKIEHISCSYVEGQGQ